MILDQLDFKEEKSCMKTKAIEGNFIIYYGNGFYLWKGGQAKYVQTSSIHHTAEPSRGTVAGTAYSVRCDHARHTAMRLLSLHFLPSGSMAVLYIFFCGLSGGINFQRLNVIFMQWRFCAAELRCSIFSLYAKAPWTQNNICSIGFRVLIFCVIYRICIFFITINFWHH